MSFQKFEYYIANDFVGSNMMTYICLVQIIREKVESPKEWLMVIVVVVQSSVGWSLKKFWGRKEIVHGIQWSLFIIC